VEVARFVALFICLGFLFRRVVVELAHFTVVWLNGSVMEVCCKLV